MTTDSDTLREEPTERERIIYQLNNLLQKLQDEWLVDNDNWYGSTHTIPAIMELIDAHDNAMKEQTEADILGRLPASSRTCTCMTCRVVTGKLNQVFSRGETDE